MRSNSWSRGVVLTLILIALAVIAAGAGWVGVSGLEPFAGKAAASGTEGAAGDRVPDGLTATDWAGIRAAHEANRASSAESIDQQAYLKPGAVGTTQADDLFGYSVAVSGDTVVVGAPDEDSSTTGVNSTADETSFNAGAAYVFSRIAGVWTQQAYLKPAAVGTTQQSDLGRAVML